MNPLVSIIICTYNRGELLKGALETLGKQDFPTSDYEIIVVDDGSDEDVEEKLKGLSLKCKFKFLKNEHGGRAKARNRGISEASGEIIFFVDDDILAPVNLISQHWKLHEKKEKIVVRGPIVDIPEYGFPEDFKPGLRDYSQAFFCTCNASVRRSAIQETGGFDETFIEYGFEDNELGWRLRQKGYKVRFNMDAFLFHYKPEYKEDVIEPLIQKARELGRSAVVFYRKHLHWKVRLATGIYSFNLMWQRIAAGRLMEKIARFAIKGKTINQSSMNFWIKRIYNFNYYDAVRQELRKAGKN